GVVGEGIGVVVTGQHVDRAGVLFDEVAGADRAVAVHAPDLGRVGGGDRTGYGGARYDRGRGGGGEGRGGCGREGGGRAGGCIGWGVGGCAGAAYGLSEGELQALGQPAGVALVLGELAADAPLHADRGAVAALGRLAIDK